MPVPDTATVQLVDGIDENAERGEPCERNDHINCRFFLLATSIIVRNRSGIHGQEKKPEEKGISHMRPSSMDKPATTSV